jgi:hypothetical protein
MTGRRVIVYYAWSKPEEANAPLEIIENRFPTLFESRRLLYPTFEELSDPVHFDQSVAGFLDHILKRNYTAFVEQASTQTGCPVVQIERINGDGKRTALEAGLLDATDTLIILSYDSLRTHQEASADEIAALRKFLAHPDHVAFICPHHDIGDVPDLPHDERVRLQTAAFLHHGDKTTPPQQRLSGLARSLLAGLGIPVENCFGLRPATNGDGSPAAIQADHRLDRLGLLRDVRTFNLHPHLPHFERLGDAAAKLDVLVRQPIDLNAPPHPFTRSGRTTFDAMLQSKAEVFAGTLLVADTTLWSSTVGGIDSLRQLWSNVVKRPGRA